MTDSVLKNKIYLLLFAVVFISAFLRFYKIDQVPVSLYWDEVSISYNAYSIVETGKDELGDRLPLLFRAFEDYKTPGYIYFTAVAIKIFGLNEFSTRVSSAFLGTITVLVTFFLIKELLEKKVFEFGSEYVAILVAFLLAISPWHIQFSRAGFEANSGLFFVVFGAYLFFRFINTLSYKFLYLSMVSFAVSIYFYRSIWIFTPLFLLSIFVIYYKDLFIKEKILKSLLAILIFIALLSPFAHVMVSGNGLARASQVSLTASYSDEVYKFAVKQEQVGGLAGKIIYNRRLVYLSEGIKAYFSHFSPKFLFINGDGNGRHGVKGMGVFYLWGIVFIIPGFLALSKYDRKTKLVILAWFLIAPIPAALALPAPHALRSLNMIPMPQIIIALGIIWVYFFINIKYRKAFFAAMIGIILCFCINYLTIYFGDNARKTSSDWGDGYKQLSEYVFQNENNYEKILISGHYWQPYIYFLFYKEYDPELFQKSGSKSGFDKYIFGGTSWDMSGKELGDQDLEKLSGTKNFLVALSPSEYSYQENKIKVVKEIVNHNNELVFIIGELKND